MCFQRHIIIIVEVRILSHRLRLYIVFPHSIHSDYLIRSYVFQSALVFDFVDTVLFVVKHQIFVHLLVQLTTNTCFWFPCVLLRWIIFPFN